MPILFKNPHHSLAQGAAATVWTALLQTTAYGCGINQGISIKPCSYVEPQIEFRKAFQFFFHASMKTRAGKLTSLKIIRAILPLKASYFNFIRLDTH